MPALRRTSLAALTATLLLPAGAAADPGTPADQRAARDASPASGVPPAPLGVPSPFRPAAPTASAAPAARAAAVKSPRTLVLSRGWSFRVGRNYEARAKDWKRVTVPHVIDASLSDRSYEGTVAWYRLRFNAPSARSGFIYALRFESVRREAVVYLNGKRLDSNEDPYTPFTVDARGLRAGARNELLVRVDSRKGENLPEGWWNWGGIVRPVELVPRGLVTASAIGLIPQLAADRTSATLSVDGLVANRSTKAIAPTVEVALRAPSGQVSRQSFTLRSLAAGGSRQERLELPIAGAPELWSPERPQLYDATVTVRNGSRTEQVDRRQIGLRQVQVTGGRLYLNGRPLQARGAAIHEDIPGRGPALRPADMDAIVAELKDVGASLTRTHYLFNEGLLERFDQTGILVWNEAPVFQRDRRLRTAAGRSEALGQLQRTVVEARDHPSVIVNSIGNELAARADATPGTSSYITTAAALAKRLDPTVPVGLAIRTRPGTPAQQAYDAIDVLGFNNYLGWYPCPPKPPTSLSQLLPFVDELRAEYPRQALLMSEFGAEATRPGPATTKDTFRFQSDYVGQVLDAVDQRPFLAGTVYWTLREFAVSRRWDGGSCRPRSQDTAIHRKGLLDYRTAAAKPAWSVLRARYQGTPLYGAVG